MINEKQVAISESTCSGVFGTTPAGQGGKAIMSVDTLSQLAMERASTAREAVQLMGDMAVAHGFYGAGSFEGSAEVGACATLLARTHWHARTVTHARIMCALKGHADTRAHTHTRARSRFLIHMYVDVHVHGQSLMVSDPTEGWVFHVLPDPTGTSAIWAAQRVPNGHVTVVPNIFIIRDVDLTDKANFAGSPNMYTVAQARGWWKPGTPLDFTAVYSDGEYAHKFYSGRRLWRAFDMLSPSLKLSPDYDNMKTARPYPFSVKPDKAVNVEDVMAIMSDSLEGTAFDMTKGLAAGAFGSPDRWMGGAGEQAVAGNWERPIALFRTSDSYVIQSRSWLPDHKGGVIWFGPHAAHATVYVPFTIGMLHLPEEYSVGNPWRLSRKSAYWAHRYVENLANLRWKDMIVDIRNARQHAVAKSTALLALLDKAADMSPVQVTHELVANAKSVVHRWWLLADELMEKYADGNVYGEPAGYAAWWLKAVGYPDGPPPIPPPTTDWSFHDVLW